MRPIGGEAKVEVAVAGIFGADLSGFLARAAEDHWGSNWQVELSTAVFPVRSGHCLEWRAGAPNLSPGLRF